MSDQNQPIEGEKVWEKKSENATIQVYKLPNGKHIGYVEYQTKHMPRPLTFETQEAEDISQAKQFTYFILHEASEYA